LPNKTSMVWHTIDTAPFLGTVAPCRREESILSRMSMTVKQLAAWRRRTRISQVQAAAVRCVTVKLYARSVRPKVPTTGWGR
jgi:hypothetical protein